MTLIPRHLDQEVLRRVAEDGEMKYDKWPDMVDPVLERINHIVYTEFPVPQPFPTINRTRPPISPQILSRHQLESSQTNTPASNGPIIPSTPTPARNLPPVPLFPNSSTTTTPNTSQIPDSLPPSQLQTESRVDLPAPLLQLLHGIIKTIQSTFLTYPPHTIQRLAELVLEPTAHYKTLPAWLRAVDRVVSVTSTADIFPLPRAMPLPSHVIDSSLLSNGVHANVGNEVGAGDLGGVLRLSDTERRNGDDNNGLGSDESLGGALLTPIPWLKNGLGPGGSEDSGDLVDGDEDTDDLLGDPIELPGTGPADPLVPERQDGAVTQGELIRQEQEAGVVPVPHGPPDPGMLMDDDEDDEDEDEHGEEVPHARGPGTVGLVDVGRVGGRKLEVNIGSGSPNAKDDKGVRDAQEVLSGGVPSGRDLEDEMQIDTSAPATASSGTTSSSSAVSDEPGVDVELPDVDESDAEKTTKP